MATQPLRSHLLPVSNAAAVTSQLSITNAWSSVMKSFIGPSPGTMLCGVTPNLDATRLSDASAVGPSDGSGADHSSSHFAKMGGPKDAADAWQATMNRFAHSLPAGPELSRNSSNDSSVSWIPVLT